ncbi:MAG: hypothetical protein RQM90_00915 [Methanoculleus sp.]
MGGKPIVHSKFKESRVPGGGFRVKDDGPRIVIEDRLRYSSDLVEKGNMSLNDICQGFPGSQKREPIKRMVEHERSKGVRSRDSIKFELDFPEIKLSTLTFIGLLGDEHFTVALFCAPPGYLTLYCGITQRVAGCDKMMPDEFGVASLFLRFLAVLLEDAIDHLLNFRRDDAAGLMDLSILGENLFDHTIPGSLRAENILSNRVM